MRALVRISIVGDRNPSVWRLLWASAENEMNKVHLQSYRRSKSQLKQHEVKAKKVKEQEWEKGADFKYSQLQSKAICSVVDILEQCTGKPVVQATIVLSAVVAQMIKYPLFDENEILTTDSKNKNTAMGNFFDRAQ